MRLDLQTWRDVERYLETADVIIMPIGSIEQHGPNGLLGTDALNAEAIARGVGETTGAMVGPVLAVGMAQHHLAFAGTMTLRPSTLIAVIHDCIVSLARHGFKRFYFINGHGGNIPAVTAAFSEVYADQSLQTGGNRPALRCRLKNWWQTPAIAALSNELFGDAEGSHATPSEVALTWHFHPDAARPMTLDPPLAPSGEFTDADDFRRRFPDGRIGSNPGLASVAAGRRVFETSVRELARDFETWRAER